MTQGLLVFAGGGAGSLLRYLIGETMRQTTVTLPLATFISNLLACAIFAGVVFAGRHTQIPNAMQVLLLTGFCGGLSTFSTFGYESYLLLRQGMLFWALANILLSTLLALFMFRLLAR